MTTPRVLPTVLATLALGALATGLPACRGDRSSKRPRQFFPDMDDQPKFKSQSETEFFADGRTMRTPVPGAVAFGRTSLVSGDEWAQSYASQRDQLLKADPGIYAGRDEAGAFLTQIPANLPVDAALLDIGQRKFNTYCAACHGYDGEGKGMVGQKWSYPLPSFYDPKYADRSLDTGKDGYLWTVVRLGVYDAQGVQKMPGYAHAITEHEAWGVVAYLRALQASRTGSLQDLPEAQREILRSQSTAPQAGAASPAPASDGGDA